MSEKNKPVRTSPGNQEEKPQPWMDTIGYEFASAKKKYEIYLSTIRQLK
ncbi:MAG: hypothetical protein JJE25_06715, partial [Bacteroidia bacterium]|nr:hypothetical protein [Bacteroidia bacterium]